MGSIHLAFTRRPLVKDCASSYLELRYWMCGTEGDLSWSSNWSSHPDSQHGHPSRYAPIHPLISSPVLRQLNLIYRRKQTFHQKYIHSQYVFSYRGITSDVVWWWGRVVAGLEGFCERGGSGCDYWIQHLEFRSALFARSSKDVEGGAISLSRSIERYVSDFLSSLLPPIIINN